VPQSGVAVSVCAIEYLQQAADAFQKNNENAVVMAEVWRNVARLGGAWGPHRWNVASPIVMIRPLPL
jgi:hypothetical protein